MTQTLQSHEESIDFSRILASFCRHWGVLGACAAGGLITTGFLTARSPRIWQASFQIVLNDDKQPSALSSLLSQGSQLGALLGNNGISSALSSAGGANQQETELKILLSPSVLLPVFNFVKTQSGQLNSSNLKFNSWASAVSAKAAKGTSVLEVSYQGVNPDLVLAASRKLASTYQNYSGRKRQRSLQAAVSYIEQQLDEYRPKEKASRIRFESFAQRYSLTNSDAIPITQNTAGSSIGTGNSLNALISDITNAATTGTQGGSIKSQEQDLNKRLFNLKYTLARAQQAGNDELINPMGISSSNINNALAAISGSEAKISNVHEYDRLIAERSSIFQDNDPTIATLRRQRKVLIGTINRQTIIELKSSIRQTQAQIDNLQRPAGVLSSFQQLSQEAARNTTLVQNLETTLAQQKLELARDSQPWDLISMPTLQDDPVSPKPLRNLAFGLIAGLISGAAGALLLDRRLEIVHHSDDLLELLPYPLLGKLESPNPEGWKTLLDLIAHGPLTGCLTVALIPIGVVESQVQPLQIALQSVLQQADPAAQVILTHDLIQASRYQAQVLVARLGTAKKEQLMQLKTNLQLQGKPVAGLLLLGTPKANEDAQ